MILQRISSAKSSLVATAAIKKRTDVANRGDIVVGGTRLLQPIITLSDNFHTTNTNCASNRNNNDNNNNSNDGGSPTNTSTNSRVARIQRRSIATNMTYESVENAPTHSSPAYIRNIIEHTMKQQFGFAQQQFGFAQQPFSRDDETRYERVIQTNTTTTPFLHRETNPVVATYDRYQFNSAFNTKNQFSMLSTAPLLPEMPQPEFFEHHHQFFLNVLSKLKLKEAKSEFDELGIDEQFGISDEELLEEDATHITNKATDLNSYISKMKKAGYRTKGLRRTLELFHEMKSNGIQPDERAYQTIFFLCGKFQPEVNRKTAFQYFRQLKQSGAEISTLTYNFLLRILAECGDSQQMAELFVKMKENDFSRPDLLTYKLMLKGCQKDGDFSLGLSVVKDMTEAGHKLDKYTYSLLIDLCRHIKKNTQNQEATADRYGDIERGSGADDADSETSSNHWPSWQYALKIFEDMKAQGIEPTTDIYNTVLNVLAGELSQLELEEIPVPSSPLDAMNMTMTYDGNSISNKVDAAIINTMLQLCAEMKQKGVPYDTTTYNTLIKAFSRIGLYNRAFAIFDSMTDVPPDHVTFSEVLFTCSFIPDTTQRIMKALHYAKLMSESPVKKTIDMYNALLNAISHSRDLEIVAPIREEMALRDIVPDTRTYTILLRMCLNSANLDKAIEYLVEMRFWKIELTNRMYSMLIDMCNDKLVFSRSSFYCPGVRLYKRKPKQSEEFPGFPGSGLRDKLRSGTDFALHLLKEYKKYHAENKQRHSHNHQCSSPTSKDHQLNKIYNKVLGVMAANSIRDERILQLAAEMQDLGLTPNKEIIDKYYKHAELLARRREQHAARAMAAEAVPATATATTTIATTATTTGTTAETTTTTTAETTTTTTAETTTTTAETTTTTTTETTTTTTTTAATEQEDFYDNDDEVEVDEEDGEEEESDDFDYDEYELDDYDDYDDYDDSYFDSTDE